MWDMYHLRDFILANDYILFKRALFVYTYFYTHLPVYPGRHLQIQYSHSLNDVAHFVLVGPSVQVVPGVEHVIEVTYFLLKGKHQGYS